MRLAGSAKIDQQAGLMIAYLLIILVLSLSVAAVGLYVSQTSNLTHRRTSMTTAMHVAEGAAVVGAQDLNTAMTNTGSLSVGSALGSSSYAPYTIDTSLGGGSNIVYERVVAAGAPFNNQSALVQICLPNQASFSTAQIIATVTNQGVIQSATANVGVIGYGAAIVDVNDGSQDTSASKGSAQEGNVAISGGAGGGGPGGGTTGIWTNYAMVLYGGSNGLAVMANGQVNVSSTNTSVVDIPPNSISKTNSEAGTPLPDYTNQGTTNALFQIARFVAVAQMTHVPTNINPNGNNEFTNLATFINAISTYATDAAHALQGVVVVDVSKNDSWHDVSTGINVEGCLVFNFVGSGWNATSTKIVIDCPVNINPANVSGLNPTNPATYTTGYPPVYLNPSNAPYNINITNVVDPLTGLKDFHNFMSGDDLPALLWTIGVVDLHNSLNISGVVYTPSYIEIENKHAGDLQYIRGQVLCGYGMYYENNSWAASVISYDANAVKNLATAGNLLKKLVVQYWQ